MKLFLSSMAVSAEQAPEFLGLFNKDAADIHLALIENAAEVEDGDKQWMYDNRRAIKNLGVVLSLVDLNDYKKDRQGLQKTLSAQDGIWLGGGNTFYLRWLLAQTGADEMIIKMVEDGMVYGGGSAGAIVAGPNLHGFELADDIAQSPEIIWTGLRLIDTVVVPHSQSEDFGPVMEKIRTIERAGFETCPLTNEQALVINGSQHHIIG